MKYSIYAVFIASFLSQAFVFGQEESVNRSFLLRAEYGSAFTLSENIEGYFVSLSI